VLKARTLDAFVNRAGAATNVNAANGLCTIDAGSIGDLGFICKAAAFYTRMFCGTWSDSFKKPQILPRESSIFNIFNSGMINQSTSTIRERFIQVDRENAETPRQFKRSLGDGKE